MGKAAQKYVDTKKVWGLIVACLLLSGVVGNAKTFFGLTVSREALMYITSPLSIILIAFAIALVFMRKSLTKSKLIDGSLSLAAITLFIVGWHFAAGPSDWSGNDGYTVTGAFLMMFSGIIAGYLIAKKRK